MSTKIFNGYRLKIKDTKTVLKFLNDNLRGPLQELAKKDYARMYAYLVKEYYDRTMFFLENPDKEGVFWNVDKKLHEIEKNLLGVFPEKQAFDPFFDIVLFPRENDHLLLIYEFNHEYRDFWNELKENTSYLEYYGYWNNSDPPEDVPYEDFEKRGDEWDEVLGGDGWGVPSECGLNWKLLSKFPSMHDTKDLIIEKLNDNSKLLNRINGIAFDLTVKLNSDYFDSFKHLKWSDITEAVHGKFKDDYEEFRIAVDQKIKTVWTIQDIIG